MTAAPEHFDVLIVGAGLSGVGAAWHLQKRLPAKTYAILEGRGAIGGTWDLFRYPGVRSDSDMFTLGYRFKPWTEEKTLAGGTAIRSYVSETARENGIAGKIRFNHLVTDLSWSSNEARWTVTAQHDGKTLRFTCGFLWMCSGYYRYKEGYTPDFKGAAAFKGRIVHPQKWPEDLDYAGKRVVVIGSGATAITLVPEMAKTAGHVVMLQRSPSYLFSLPGTNAISKIFGAFLPKSVVYRLVRAISVPLQMYFYGKARGQPEKMKTFLIDHVREQLPAGYDVARHFTPRYNPWDERLCFVDDGDFFKAISAGRASVATDEIETFTERGLKLKSGAEIEADIVVSATGLVLQSLGGAKALIDGKPLVVGDTLTYKGLMYEGAPNLVAVFGYLNASWTLRADLVSDYVCRLIKYMDKSGSVSATPVNADPAVEKRPFSDFTSGYVARGLDATPKQGPAPWRHPQNFYTDFFSIRLGRLDDGVMRFAKRRAATAQAQTPKLAAE